MVIKSLVKGPGVILNEDYINAIFILSFVRN